MFTHQFNNLFLCNKLITSFSALWLEWARLANSGSSSSVKDFSIPSFSFRANWWKLKAITLVRTVVTSVTRLGDFLLFGWLFKFLGTYFGKSRPNLNKIFWIGKTFYHLSPCDLNMGYFCPNHQVTLVVTLLTVCHTKATRKHFRVPLCFVKVS